MKLSRRALRKVRRAKKSTAVASINLVSMIDIFTIMIIYLLVNTAAVQISGAEQVDMPKSLALEPPRETVAVIVNATDVLVDGKAVMKVADIHEGDALLPLLKERLLSISPPTPSQAQAGDDAGEVNILADKSISYSLLKKVMATCADARFAKISLGVIPAGKSGT
jgi:biopolymer transport protein TolR